MKKNENDTLSKIKNQLSSNNEIKLNIDDIDITITTSVIKKICSIEMYFSLVADEDQINKILNIYNSCQNGIIYQKTSEANKIKMLSCLWIDTKPTYKVLKEIINEMISSIKSMKQIIETERNI